MNTLCALSLALLLPARLEGHLPQKCGETVDSRIVGGTKADTKKYIYYTGLVNREYFNHRALSLSCGGSLIRSDKVLTAAHCYDKTKANWMFKYVAVFDIVDKCRYQFDSYSEITHVEMHPLWNTMSKNGDLAIATLKDHVKHPTICLAPKGYRDYPKPAYVVGLGLTEENGSSKHVCNLLEIKIQIFTRAQCMATLMKGIFIFRTGILCAGTLSGEYDSCQGDSGGPLIRIDKGIHYLQGVVSTGLGCGRENAPGIYADVSAHRIWIDRVLKNSSQTTQYGATTNSGPYGGRTTSSSRRTSRGWQPSSNLRYPSENSPTRSYYSGYSNYRY